MIEAINSKYDGHYDEFNRRHSKGLQTWTKHEKEQDYKGEFFRDCIHGEGIYKWQKESGWEVYDGYFYANAKDGYGSVSLPNGSSFEGLFCNNRPFGPGVFTYGNGRQDAGFWLGTKIIRLSRVVDYIIPRLAYTSVGKIKLFSYRKIITVDSENNSGVAVKPFGSNTDLIPRLHSALINDPRSLFFCKRNFNGSYFKKFNYENMQELNVWPSKETEDENSESEEVEEQEEKMGLLNNADLHGVDLRKAKHEPKPKSEYLVCWNRNEISEEIAKKIFYYHSLEGKLTFKISNLMTGDRPKFKKTGYQEKDCIQFLKMCSIGPSYVINEFLCSCGVSEELTDARGNNSLMFAACGDQHDIIDLLVSHGVNINSFNDEHLTPLNLCLLRRIALGNKILNWERAYLPPNQEPLLAEAHPETEGWGGTKSFESLDRFFGDGMSIDENPAPSIPPSIQGSFSNIHERLDTTMSTITVLKFAQLKTLAKTESVYHDKFSKIVPKTIRREEYLNSITEPNENDRYFFDLSPEPAPAVEIKKSAKAKGAKEVAVIEVEKQQKDEEVIKKCETINKTIKILLRRGADANISDVPKPSIHLGVFTKDPEIVGMLLKFEGFVDTRSLFTEGFLTPLHVTVLMKPAEESVLICEVLLAYGADLEAETSPDFNPNGEKEIFLDEDHGRTPLQLLCMRPDLEYVKHNQCLIEMALLLAKNSNRKNYFKGHNFLTLAMLRGNLKLVEAFLANGIFNSNETCEHGTPLHVLVSTFLQMRIPFDESIQMCDLLLNNGADPSKKSKKRNCVEFGYKEIEEEKEKRKLKKIKDGNKERDHIKDHTKVVEYLDKKLKELKQKRPNMLGEAEELYDASEMDLNKKAEEKSSPVKLKPKLETEEKGVEEKTKREIVKKSVAKANKIEDSDLGGEKGEKDSKERKEKKDEADENKKDRVDKSEKEGLKATTPNGKDLNKAHGAIKTDKTSEKKKTVKSDTAKATKKNIDKKVPKVSAEIQAKDRLNKESKPPTEIKELEEKEKLEKLKKDLSIKKENIKVKRNEKLQKLLYEILGNCQESININDLLLPYVVLRDGDLYYHFHERKTKNMEAYSLI